MIFICYNFIGVAFSHLYLTVVAENDCTVQYAVFSSELRNALSWNRRTFTKFVMEGENEVFERTLKFHH